MSLYEILSLVIGGVGAIATFSAVFVALWQTKYANKKKLSCKFIENNAVASLNGENIKNYVCMSITNIGNKKVIIKSWGIKTKNEFLMILTQIPNPDAFDLAVSVKTPHELDLEQNVSFFYDKRLFVDYIKKSIELGKISRTKKIIFHVIDSTGKKYIVKSPKPACQYIEIKKQ